MRALDSIKLNELTSLRHVLVVWIWISSWSFIFGNSTGQLKWDPILPIPDEMGVAGPFAGICQDHLVVAGGARFPHPIWESPKVYSSAIYAKDLSQMDSPWKLWGELEVPLAYGASVSIPEGLVCLGGSDGTSHSDRAFLLRRNADGVVGIYELPGLPAPFAFGQAVFTGGCIYVVAGQREPQLQSAMNSLWCLRMDRLHLSDSGGNAGVDWVILPPIPGPGRALPVMTAQHDGFDACLFVTSGRCEKEGDIQFLRDHWKYNFTTQKWIRQSDAPFCFMGGVGFPLGQSHLAIVSGDPGDYFFRTDELRDQHPGFPRKSYAYHAITDVWSEIGDTPINQVTTVAVPYKNEIYIPSGEIRPRVRTPSVYRLSVQKRENTFAPGNFIVLFVYMLVITGIGFYCARKNKNTDDYFRGGQNIYWWAAGCSVFATMLSSLTYTGLPAKAYAQDWVYAIGNFMIPLVSLYAVRIALPFFRGLNAASAYEYLERRFGRSIRLSASGIFILFHLFRMAIVMSLTSLALAVATPLGPYQSVLLMGILCVMYSVAGGVEAVIWTDTVQAVVLLAGAITALGYIITGMDGGWTQWIETSLSANKLNLANWSWDPRATHIGIWFVIAGSLGQNLSSYTSDQAVVQRYLTTSTQSRAAQAIWLNAILSVVATILFFAIGTALFGYFRNHPERLDLSINTDQIFPFYIISQMPVGISGLIIAGIFAAAQSTVSTSINSMATALLTDFISRNPDESSPQMNLKRARRISFFLGVAGTLLALLFISPGIKSLFDVFIKVIGLFMGISGGVFLLGMVTRRVQTRAAFMGMILAMMTVTAVWLWTSIHAYLYPFIGVGMCFLCGYVISFFDLGWMKIHSARR